MNAQNQPVASSLFIDTTNSVKSLEINQSLFNNYLDQLNSNYHTLIAEIQVRCFLVRYPTAKSLNTLCVSQREQLAVTKKAAASAAAFEDLVYVLFIL